MRRRKAEVFIIGRRYYVRGKVIPTGEWTLARVTKAEAEQFKRYGFVKLKKVI